MANNPERDCSTCKYGDNGSNPEGCPETCFEPDLPDYDPEPEHPTRAELLHDIKQLREECAYLRSICETAEQRLRFALDAFKVHPFNQNRPRPPFRNASVTTDTKSKDTKKPFLPLVDARGISHNDYDNPTKAEPLGEAPINPQTRPRKPR
jgi:hypothetical protein